MYKGIQVGSLKTLEIDPDLSSANAELTLDPLAEDYLVQDTQFWVVKPSISLARSPCRRDGWRCSYL